eukprot:15365451-Ditylum_brightwellii.AAC.2
MRRAPIGSGNLEKFLHHFESALLEANNKEILQSSNKKDKSFTRLFDNLKQDGSIVIVLTDKTNRKAKLYAAKLQPTLAKGEMAFLNEGIASKAIPQPQLLVKDHKDREENGDYPTCLALDLKEKLEALELKRDKSMLIQYYGQYYAYKGVAKGKTMAAEDIVLAIGAYESAFCADIVSSYIFKMTETCLLHAKHQGIFRDDGLVIFTGKWTRIQISHWLS